MAGVAFMDVKLGYVGVEAPTAIKIIGVPEQSADTLIPEGQLLPGHVFAVGRSVNDEYAVYKLENKAASGNCRF